ncbi:hypothetical protein [Devosia sp. A16]|uniref:hypothetical protein n=1 Tax=Devosia sp. A16 TaxID=1736675 RepID=UPI0006D83BE4|nr:hypothetical protein [Devosia sp. A16]
MMVNTDFDEVTDADLVGYWKASDILNDPALSVTRKRALLAHWASDIHAVAGTPSLRNARGVSVSIDSLLDALAALDDEVDAAAMAHGTPGARPSW